MIFFLYYIFKRIKKKGGKKFTTQNHENKENKGKTEIFLNISGKTALN